MKDPKNSEVLWAKIHLAERRLFAATHVFWNHHALSDLLPKFLIQALILIRSGLTLMEVARERSLAQPEDAVSRVLAAYLQVHLAEERGHDLWLLDDIRALGLEEQEILRTQPCTAVVDLVGAQYFWMMHVHPVAIMGYLILMEGYAPLKEQLDQIRIRSGAPADAFRCLVRHADDDPGHLADLNQILDGMNLSADQARAVGMCAFAAIEGLSSMFEQLLATVPEPDEQYKELCDACA
jgi:hypothetical protein